MHAPHAQSLPDNSLTLPAAPILVVRVRTAYWLDENGIGETLSLREAVRRLHHHMRPVIVCHALSVARRLKISPFPALDILELFAFCHPAKFCLPTAKGLAAFLGLSEPHSIEDDARALYEVMKKLLAGLGEAGLDAAPTAWAMSRGGWHWGKIVLAALKQGPESPHSGALVRALQVWHGLKEWSEFAPEPASSHLPVEPVEARAALAKLLGTKSEERPQQKSFAESVTHAFGAIENDGEPKVVLSEAGTGVGKTLGYIAPASVWAKKNSGSVWISTFTRNLQRQLDGELDKLYPDQSEKRRKVVVRKGRENYLCLLNFEEKIAGLATRPLDAIALGLMARWARNTRDGDMVGGDFPSWLSELLGPRLSVEMTDTRGECIYSSCTHYSKCFIEKTVRRARRAEIVVANHALVMIQAALGTGEESGSPTRYVFDEGHHVFDAADKAFSAHLTGLEGAELRRWLLGAEDGARSRARGLKSRIEDLVAGEEMSEALDEALRAARVLPGPNWHQRMGQGGAMGSYEKLLARIRQQVYARDTNTNSPYSLETGVHPTIDGLLVEAEFLDEALDALRIPLQKLLKGLIALLDDEAEELETNTRLRIESVCRSLERRGVQQIHNWRAMLKSLQSVPSADYIDWFSVERTDGRDIDVGMHRHWVDPTIPFAETLLRQSQGVAITSATLRDGSGDEEADWDAAKRRSGVNHLPAPAVLSSHASPFDYPANTRVLLVNDVRRDSADQVSAAYRELFLAAGGGGLGLFTAIHRLRAVYNRISEPLDAAGLPVYAQHVDAMDVGTLIDIFRAEETSCLLGTDAVRDGVDVPGQSLQLIVFDRVPWPRPQILHQARKRAWGKGYDDMLTRLRLKQAFGRLIRRNSDKGVFVMLDKAMPSRLLGAFPKGTPIERVGLAEAVRMTRDFLSTPELD